MRSQHREVGMGKRVKDSRAAPGTWIRTDFIHIAYHSQPHLLPKISTVPTKELLEFLPAQESFRGSKWGKEHTKNIRTSL